MPVPSLERTAPKPTPVTALVTTTGIPSAAVTPSAAGIPSTIALTVASTPILFFALSILVSTTRVDAPLSIAITSKRSKRPGGIGWSSATTIPTTSIFAANVCIFSRLAGSLRVKVVRLGITAAITQGADRFETLMTLALLTSKLLTAALLTTSTQSPVTGAVSDCAVTESDCTRSKPLDVTTSHSPRSTRTTLPSSPLASTNLLRSPMGLLDELLLALM